MKKTFRQYPETMLIILAVVFLAAIIGVFSWGIGVVVVQVNRVEGAAQPTANHIDFNLSGAKALDLRGLVKTQP